MAVFAHIAEAGTLVAFYDTEIGVPPPFDDLGAALVEVSPEVRDAWISNPWQKMVDGALIPSPPPPPTSGQILANLPAVSHAQIIAALIVTGILTEAEGVDWIAGTLPAAVEAMIAALPAEQRTIARLRAIRPSEVVPTDPLVAALAASEGKSIEDLIAIFTSAAAL